MTREAERAKSVQKFARLFASGRFDSVLPMLEAKLVTSFVNGLLRFAEVKPPRYELMRDRLDGAVRDGTRLRATRPKRALLAWPEFLKTMDGILRTLKAWQSEIAREEKQYEKEGAAKGLVEVDILFAFVDFNNTLPKGGKVTLQFPASKVKLASAMKAGGARFRGIMLEPSKSRVIVNVALQRKVKPKLANHLVYNPLKAGEVLVIKAREDAAKATKKDHSAEGAVKKSGVKGTVGIDFKVISGGGEITREKELSKTHGRELSYTILWPKGSMSLAQK
ncbi:hypothetical protein LNKW23_08570 [Paralimibaculum aggregatum]|uniref:Uncharacterized protein n=1 Tax=Paralimibaculum aggregatum TaxID=3036245 RepID=A0ABQ6LLV7_9RHOB|nr:hypothetical protein [Limibaculum sp. NKW23]GMG81644.1 hypothetical protein LNKW23_08570 [Limibaculum sp. NKW23]